MNYLARLKQLEGAKDYQYAPDTLSPDLQLPFGSFVSTGTGDIVKNSIEESGIGVDGDISQNITNAKLPKPTEVSIGSFVSTDVERIEKITEESEREILNLPIEANCQNRQKFRDWLIHFTDRESMESCFTPAVTHAEVLDWFPEAVAAQPILDTPKRQATQAEAEELRTLVAEVYKDDAEADRAEALDAALADPDGALLCYRGIAAERHRG